MTRTGTSTALMALALAIFSMPMMSQSSFAAEQSLDCTKASEAGEKAVCKSDVLLKFDHAILAHHDALAGKVGTPRADALMKKFQLARQHCFGEASCILQASQNAIGLFHQAGSPLDKSTDPEAK